MPLLESRHVRPDARQKSETAAHFIIDLFFTACHALIIIQAESDE
jgi:hypothetical protein